jgi:hypothetical protein
MNAAIAVLAGGHLDRHRIATGQKGSFHRTIGIPGAIAPGAKPLCSLLLII